MVRRVKPLEYLAEEINGNEENSGKGTNKNPGRGEPNYPQRNKVIYRIPKWVPILLGIALVGAFSVAIYALSEKES